MEVIGEAEALEAFVRFQRSPIPGGAISVLARVEFVIGAKLDRLTGMSTRMSTHVNSSMNSGTAVRQRQSFGEPAVANVPVRGDDLPQAQQHDKNACRRCLKPTPIEQDAAPHETIGNDFPLSRETSARSSKILMTL